jgi:hypothetical protein
MVALPDNGNSADYGKTPCNGSAALIQPCSIVAKRPSNGRSPSNGKCSCNGKELRQGYIQSEVDKHIWPIPRTNPSTPVCDGDPDVCLDAGK